MFSCISRKKNQRTLKIKNNVIYVTAHNQIMIDDTKENSKTYVINQSVNINEYKNEQQKEVVQQKNIITRNETTTKNIFQQYENVIESNIEIGYNNLMKKRSFRNRRKNTTFQYFFTDQCKVKQSEHSISLQDTISNPISQILTNNTPSENNDYYKFFKKTESLNEDNFNLQINMKQQTPMEINLKDQIQDYLADLTDRFTYGYCPTNKAVQSSIEGIQHEISEYHIEDDKEIVEAECQVGSIFQAFFEAVILRNYFLAQKLFKKMTKEQKNLPNKKGLSPLKMVTFCVILNPQCKLSLRFFKQIVHDPQIIPYHYYQFNNYLECKPIEQAIKFKNIPTLTHLFQSSYRTRKKELEQNLQKFVEFLGSMDDFIIQFDAKVKSFLPLVEQIAPDDHIVIIKKQNYLRIDYTLIGYSSFKCKRRQMSCIIGKFKTTKNMIQQKCMILGVNHKNQAYTDILKQSQIIEQIIEQIDNQFFMNIQNTQLLI